MRADVLFAVCPYIAAGLLLGGIVVRCLFVSPQNGTERPLLSFAALPTFCKGFGVGLTLLLVLHLILMLLPHGVLLWNRIALRLYLLEGIAFGAGLVTLWGSTIIAWRRLNQNSSTIAGEVAEAVFQSLLLLALVSGLVMAALYRWGSSWGMMTLMPYAFSLLRGEPYVALVGRLPFWARLHVFSAFAVCAVFPLTNWAGVLAVWISRNLEDVTAPVESTVGAWRKMLSSRLQRFNPAPWIFRDEED